MSTGGNDVTIDERDEDGLEARLRAAAQSAGSLARDLSSERLRVGARRARRVGRVVTRGLIVAAVAAIVIALVVVPRQVGVANRPAPPASSFETLDVTSGAAPTLRSEEAVAYFPPDKEVVLFGGAALPSGGPALGDTWVFSRHGWRQLRTATSPSPRAGAAMAYDPETKELILFGGSSDPSPGFDQPLTDTWAFDGTSWHRLHPRNSPIYMPVPALAYDVTTHLLTLLAPTPALYNGHSPAGDFGTFWGRAFLARWIWTGDDWSYAPTTPAPNVQTGNVAFVTDPTSGKMLYYSYWWLTNCGICGMHGNPPPDPTGERGALAWTWDGDHFVKQHPKEAPQSASLVVTDSRVGLVVAVSGGRTWGWVRRGAQGRGPGGTWIVMGRAAPSDALAQAAVYDAALGEVIVVSGTLSTVTWAWDGTAWRVVPRAEQPSCSHGPVQLSVTDALSGHGLTGHGRWPLVALYQFVVLEPFKNDQPVTDLRRGTPVVVFEPQGQGWKLAGRLPDPAPSSGPPGPSPRAVIQFTSTYSSATRYLVEVPFSVVNGGNPSSGGAGSSTLDLCVGTLA